VLRLSAVIGSVCVALGVLSCGNDVVLPSDGPAEITLVGENNLSGQAGEALAESLLVQVIDRRGQPLSRQKVAFSLEGEAPGAVISPDTAVTATDGIAKARWVLGSTSGTQTAIARVVGADRVEVTLSAAVGSGAAARLESAGGNDQGAAIATTLGEPLSVRVTDAYGNPVAGVEVEWSAEQGSVDPAKNVSGGDGRAATSWTLGSSRGSQRATASSSGLEGSPVTFRATAGPGSAARLELVSGNNQSARAGSDVDERLVVRLLDQAGNGIPNRAVSWLVASGGGSVPEENTTTDDEGRASTRWTLGPEPGGNTLNAVVSGVGAVPFSATGTESGGGGGGGGDGDDDDDGDGDDDDEGGSDARGLGFAVQPSRAEEDRRISPPVQVEVLDQAGSRVTRGEFEIKLDLSGRRGRLRGDRTESTVSGVATFHDLTIERDGQYRLRASADGLPSVESVEFEVEEVDGD
jgi:hypothetical protein